MFVPVDELPPIFDELVSTGRGSRTPRPWIGIQVTEAEGWLYVTGVTNDASGRRARFEPGGIVLSLDAKPVKSLAKM